MLPGDLYDGCFLVIQAEKKGTHVWHVLALWEDQLIDVDVVRGLGLEAWKPRSGPFDGRFF